MACSEVKVVVTEDPSLCSYTSAFAGGSSKNIFIPSTRAVTNCNLVWLPEWTGMPLVPTLVDM